MVLIVDIDGTLVKVPEERRIASEKEDWKTFYEFDFAHDEPIQGVVSLVEAWLEGGGIVYVVTARLDRVIGDTCHWLVNHLPAMGFRNLNLVMRIETETEPETEWKLAQIAELCPKPTAATIIEDNPETCSRLKELGYTVLEVL